MPITQSHRPIAVNSPLGEDVLVLRRMTASEGLSRLFEFQLDLLSENDNIHLADVLGQPMTVRLELLDGGNRYFNGVVSRFCHLGPQGRYTDYQATLHPWPWLLTRTANCRIFQNQTVPDILKAIFQQRGLTDYFEDRLSAGYRTRDYCVQYRETDFNFISRLMELEGIYYYFQHTDGKHTLVLADSSSAHEATPGCEQLPYFPPDTQLSRREHIADWAYFQQVQPGVCALNDFDFTAPKKNLQSKRTIARPHAQAEFEVFDYPGGYVQSADGETYARVRIEELQAQYERFQARTNARGLAVGALFKLVECPREEQNRQYLVESTDYTLQSNEFAPASQAAAGEEFSCRFTAMDAQHPYRPLRLTPKPIVQGPQTAIVVGKAGEEIWTDKYGRVKVQFHWDRESKGDETSSCWIRVAQLWAGARWGGMAIPRIGQEVIVEFLEGDPDCPIITGRVYNGASMPPYELPSNATMTTLKSNSIKGGGGFNEIRFEDKKGQEQIFIYGEKNQDIRLKNDVYEWVGNDRHLIIKKDRLEEIDGDKHLTVKGDHNEKVSGTLSIDAGMDMQEKVGQKHALEAGMEIHLKGGMNVIIEAGMSITLKAGGGFIVVGPAGVTISGTPVLINSGGSAGSGSGCSPEAPKPPKEATTAEPGATNEVQSGSAATSSVQLSTIKVGSFTHPQAQTLANAAQTGVPFCEKCEAARRALAQQQSG